jgi:hypothetical protein
MSALKGWPGWRSTVQSKSPSAYMLSLGLKSHAGLILGGGTSADPVTAASAVSGNMASFYTKMTGTGDCRGLYWRNYVAGIGASSEAARFYTTVYGVAAGNARGVHVSLDFSAYATSYVTGEGRAIKGTLTIPNGAMVGGTYSAIQGEINCAGTASDPGPSVMSIMDFTVNGGDATAQAKVKYLLSATVPTGEEAGGNMHVSTITAATMNAACTEALRVLVNGAIRYIPLATAVV